MQQEPILIRMPNWVGDVCMALPVLDMLRRLNIPFAVCARGWAKDLLAGFGTIGFLPMSGRLLEDVLEVRDWRKKHPQYRRGLILPDSFSSALCFRLAGLQSAGWRDDGRSLLLRWPLHKPTEPLHVVQSNFALAQQALWAWGIDAQPQALPERLQLPLTKQHTQSAHDQLSAAGLKAGEFVLIAPTATGTHKGQAKVWPQFDAFTRILQNNGVQVAMCPPKAEQAAALRAVPTADLIEPLRLGGFCALARLAKVVICNDSGVSHLCAAIGAKQITLFGVTDPARTGPWSPESINLGKLGQWPTVGEVAQRTQPFLVPH
jgi:heptosyltransferase-2